MPDAPADPRALRDSLRQHARTLQLMGVDFLPVAAGIAPIDPAPAASLREVPIAQAPKPATASVSRSPIPAAPATPSIAPITPNNPITHPDPRRSEAARLLDQLRERYELDAPHKQFVTGHTRIVFGEGDPCARLMFIGEAPGAEEDKVGRPFVGRAGQLLDKMITAMGLKREEVYIANVLKTRPPNNATPTPEEAALCAPYLFEQIAIIRPEAIVALGLPASRTLLNVAESMGRLRGQWHPLHLPPSNLGIAPPLKDPVPVMPTYHPAFLLRAYTTDNRQKVWSDLQMAATKIGVAPPKKTPGTAA